MKRKILFGTDIAFSAKSGEIAHVVGLLNELSRGGGVMFLTFRKNFCILKDAGLSARVELIEFESRVGGMVERLLYFRRLLICARINNISHLYVRHSLFARVLGSTFVRPKPYQLVIEYNGVIEKETGSALRLLAMRLTMGLFRKLALRSKVNIAVSSGIQQFYKPMVGGRWVTVHNGVAPQLIDFFQQRPVRQKKDFIFVGNVTHWQDFQALIDFLKVNRDWISSSGLKVKILGSGPSDKELSSMISRASLEDLVLQLGIVRGEQMYEHLAESQVGLLLDTRTVDGQLLFSPLKYFEYSAAKLDILYVTRQQLEDLPGVLSAAPELRFSGLEEFQASCKQAAIRIQSRERSWSVVCGEIEELLS